MTTILKDCNIKTAEILLVFNMPISCQPNIKLVFRNAEQLPVFHAGPTFFLNRENGVPRYFSFQLLGQAFIKENSHKRVGKESPARAPKFGQPVHG